LFRERSSIHAFITYKSSFGIVSLFFSSTSFASFSSEGLCKAY
jgi:hypothetical protein